MTLRSQSSYPLPWALPSNTYPQPPPLLSWGSQGCEARELVPLLGSLASESLEGSGREVLSTNPRLRTKKGREEGSYHSSTPSPCLPLLGSPALVPCALCEREGLKNCLALFS